MGFTYLNRRRKTYFLQRSSSRTGKETYSFTMKPPKNPVDSVPEGFEIFEDPQTAQVFLRRPKPTEILPEELALAKQVVQQEERLRLAQVLIEKNAIVIYTSDLAPSGVDKILDELLPAGSTRRASLGEFFLQTARLSPMMRFVLVDGPTRTFQTERWCFRGSVDGWLPLFTHAALKDLLEEFVPSLGTEAFFELF